MVVLRSRGSARLTTKASRFGRSALGFLATVALLSGCGTLQPSIGVPAVKQSSEIAAHESTAHDRARIPLSYALLHSFRKNPDGRHPQARLVNLNGTLYGTTTGGGSGSCGCGTVFSITPAGTEKVLYSFAGGADGANPYADLVDVNGTLYGTTVYGGAYDSGTIFSITTGGQENVLHSFGGKTDGALPYPGLLEVKRTLYGTTFEGGKGSCGCGTVFSVTASGKERVLYSFGGGTDGAYPNAGLLAVKGTLYGTTVYGDNMSCVGSDGCGTIFSVTTGGKEKVLHSFDGADGAFPHARMVDVKGVLYGTTGGGGSTSCGCGTVFSVTTGGTERMLYSFNGGTDGAGPNGLLDVKGMLYGTTIDGGSGSCTGGCGTVFSITTGGQEKLLYSFGGGNDARSPGAGLVDVNGTLYGTTIQGGAYGFGTVFALTP